MAGTTQINPATGNTHRRKQMDVESFIALPDDGVRRELIEGEVVEMAPPSAEHQRIVRRLLILLHTHCEEHHIGEVLASPIGLRLRGISFAEPDLIYLPEGHPQHLRNVRDLVDPVLVIEVLSPSTREHDLLVKRLMYEKAGIPNYWIADPEYSTIEALALREGQYYTVEQKSSAHFSAPPFPDLAIEVAKLFPPVEK